MKLWQKLVRTSLDHSEIEARQREARRTMLKHARKLRQLEIEAGIYKQQVKGVRHSDR